LINDNNTTVEVNGLLIIEISVKTFFMAIYIFKLERVPMHNIIDMADRWMWLTVMDVEVEQAIGSEHLIWLKTALLIF